jgi:hypothetical protein
MTRELIIQIIREVVRGWPVGDVLVLADSLPTQISKGADQFCEDNDLGHWFYMQIRAHNISVAGELYRFIEESKQAVVQHKEAQTSGEKNHGRP